jgi:2-polyprenyl-3-methyl-5-hydroxy-6-metoxy-1,4-benzoquinol methylase
MSEPMPNVSPELFFETANSFQKSAALKAAIELDLFTQIEEGSSAKELAKKCKASERGIRILSNYLAIQGMLIKEGDVYKCTPDSKVFLSRKSPAYLASAVDFLLAPVMMSAYDNLAETVRTGRTILPGEGSVAPEHPMWVTFAEAMAPFISFPAEQIAQMAGFPQDAKIRVLDIAASHGMFGIAFARKYPAAEIHAVDWSSVLNLAKSNAQKAGVQDRYRTIPGDAFEVEFGTDYDVALITNFLHHFDPPTCIRFLRKVSASLKPKGKAITLEFVPNEDRVTPKIPAAFSLIMLATTGSGDAYTFKELEEMHLDAGFSRSTLHPLPPSPQSVVIAEK